jgi:hypothetical protein
MTHNSEPVTPNAVIRVAAFQSGVRPPIAFTTQATSANFRTSIPETSYPLGGNVSSAVAI